MDFYCDLQFMLKQRQEAESNAIAVVNKKNVSDEEKLSEIADIKKAFEM